MKRYLFIVILLVLVPVAYSAVIYLLGDRRKNWQTADRSSAGLLPRASDHPPALIRVFAARTVRWRGIFAVHTWIVVKECGVNRYSRYDYTAWGEPIRRRIPRGWQVVGVFLKRSQASMAKRPSCSFPRFRSVVESYRFRAYGDYSPWPGPNSNTFIQAILDAVPELNAVLPPTAIGKDYPYHGDWDGLTASRTGVFASLGGYLGLTIGWIEGIELNFFGGVLGLDIRRPALKLPGVGRLGLPLAR